MPHAGLWQRLLISELATDAPELFAIWGQGLVQRWNVVASLIQEGQKRGQFRRDLDPAITARLIVSALSYQALFHVHLGLNRLAPCDPEDLVESAIVQLLKTLRVRGRR
jgi:hypothetical protein